MGQGQAKEGYEARAGAQLLSPFSKAALATGVSILHGAALILSARRAGWASTQARGAGGLSILVAPPVAQHPALVP